VLVVLIGNKCDMDSDRVISTQDGERLAKVSISLVEQMLAFVSVVLNCCSYIL